MGGISRRDSEIPHMFSLPTTFLFHLYAGQGEHTGEKTKRFM